MIFNINLTRGQMRFLTCVARVTCLVWVKEWWWWMCREREGKEDRRGDGWTSWSMTRQRKNHRVKRHKTDWRPRVWNIVPYIKVEHADFNTFVDRATIFITCWISDLWTERQFCRLKVRRRCDNENMEVNGRNLNLRKHKTEHIKSSTQVAVSS